MNSNKKLALLYIIDILKDYSSEYNLLTQNDIIDKLKLLHDFDLERKAVSYNISLLEEYGFDIVHVSKKGYYLGQRHFESSEIKYLVDAIFSSKSISSKLAFDMIEKLISFLPIEDRKQFLYMHRVDDISRSENKSTLLNVEIIMDAIKQKKKISFNYYDLDMDGNRNLRRGGKRYVVNPYHLIYNISSYYLLCNFDYFDTLANYKVHHMVDIKIIDKDIKPLENIVGKNFNISKYINENVFLFDGDVIETTIKLSHPSFISVIKENFGNSAKSIDKDTVVIKCNENSIVYWCLQYGNSVELVSPEHSREKVKSLIKETYKKYN